MAILQVLIRSIIWPLIVIKSDHPSPSKRWQEDGHNKSCTDWQKRQSAQIKSYRRSGYSKFDLEIEIIAIYCRYRRAESLYNRHTHRILWTSDRYNMKPRLDDDATATTPLQPHTGPPIYM